LTLFQSLVLKTSCSPPPHHLTTSGLLGHKLKSQAASPIIGEDGAESSGEEDDILDAIAEWQENEH
jgi:hypothetical protein